MTGQMSSFFDEMLEAAKAKEALPTIQSERDHAIARTQFLEERVTEIGDINIQLQNRINKLEADLAQATKSSTSHKEHLDLLLDEVRKAMGQVAVATDIVDPKPEPEVVELPNPLSVGEVGQSDPTTGGVISPWSSAVFVEPTSSPGNDPSTATGEATQSPSGQSEANPTVQQPTPDLQGSSSVSTDKPSDPKPYWLKPSNLTWGEWKERGNDVPYWATDEADVMNTI